MLLTKARKKSLLKKTMFPPMMTGSLLLDAYCLLVNLNVSSLQAAMSTMDGIINTVSANIPMAPLLGLLKPNGKMIMVGLPEKPMEISPFSLVARKSSDLTSLAIYILSCLTILRNHALHYRPQAFSFVRN